MPLKYMLPRRDNVMTDKKQQKARDEEELSKCPPTPKNHGVDSLGQF